MKVSANYDGRNIPTFLSALLEKSIFQGLNYSLLHTLFAMESIANITWKYDMSGGALVYNHLNLNYDR